MRKQLENLIVLRRSGSINEVPECKIVNTKSITIDFVIERSKSLCNRCAICDKIVHLIAKQYSCGVIVTKVESKRHNVHLFEPSIFCNAVVV